MTAAGVPGSTTLPALPRSGLVSGAELGPLRERGPSRRPGRGRVRGRGRGPRARPGDRPGEVDEYEYYDSEDMSMSYDDPEEVRDEW